jgi:tetratricopeptide (TPR) repeat protein
VPRQTPTRPKRPLAGFLLATLLLPLAASGAPAIAGDRGEIEFAVSIAKKGLWSEAAHRFRSLLDRDPENPRLWNNMAVALEATGKFDEAKQAYEKAAALAGTRHKEIQNNKEAFQAFYDNRAARAAGRKAASAPGETPAPPPKPPQPPPPPPQPPPAEPKPEGKAADSPPRGNRS